MAFFFLRRRASLFDRCHRRRRSSLITRLFVTCLRKRRMSCSSDSLARRLTLTKYFLHVTTYYGDSFATEDS